VAALLSIESRPRGPRTLLELCSSWVAVVRSGPHRINSGTLYYLPRWLPAAMHARIPLLAGALHSRLGESSRVDRIVHDRTSNVDDGMTNRGRVRVANTGRVIGRPPGVDHPRGATRGRLVSRTQRALELTECSPWLDDSYDSTMFPLRPRLRQQPHPMKRSLFASREHVPPPSPSLFARNEFSA